MTKKILFVPLDERPCNYSFPEKLIKCSKDYELLEPSRSILGSKKEPTNYCKLEKFILDNCKKADVAVISIDQLLYGGIVPSRVHNLDIDTLSNRLSILKRIKEINPNIILYCFLLIMRCPNYSSSDEEPDYYEKYGEIINKIGTKIHKKEDYSSCLNDEIKPYLDDYINRRKKNLEMIKRTLSLSKDIIDFLIIPQDDSQPYGFTMMDRIEVLDAIKELKLDNIELYPGADEIGLTLLSRAINKINSNKKLIYLDFMYESSKDIIPAYENKPLLDTIKHHINASGNLITDDYNKADIVLFLNYDKDKELESVNPVNIIDKDAYIKQISRMIIAKKNSKIVGLVDKFYVNGGNIEYMKLLNELFGINNIDCYSGWNTSSNSLGTVIAFSTVISYSGRSDNSSIFVVERLYDDLIYQAKMRKYIVENMLPKLGLNYFDSGDTQGEVSIIVRDELNKYMKENFFNIYSEYKLNEVRMPWKRMFEIDVEVSK